MQVPALDTRNSFAQQLFAPLPARYDRLAEILSFGQNARWRRAMVDRLVKAPGGDSTGDANRVVLDVAAGTAGVSLQLTARTGARVIGLDLTEQMLRQGAQNIAAAGADGRVSLVNARAEQLPLPDASVDALTFTYLLRYVRDPQATLAELARVVRPGGTVASLEFYVPPSPFWRFWWRAYTASALPLGGLITGGRQWYEVGRFLGPSIASHYSRYPIDWTVRAWQQAGLRDVGYSVMSLGGGLVMWGTRAGG
ncbi:MAG TPA: class I SAM-dependent methyltransferase [Streptosporangiaceae bacterium]|nr:class I SAM-dependent methyltransferase [Streptosporangiaceae bacterium]